MAREKPEVLNPMDLWMFTRPGAIVHFTDWLPSVLAASNGTGGGSFPDADNISLILFDGGNNNRAFLRFLKLTNGVVTQSRDTELDGITAYTVLGSVTNVLPQTPPPPVPYVFSKKRYKSNYTRRTWFKTPIDNSSIVQYLNNLNNGGYLKLKIDGVFYNGVLYPTGDTVDFPKVEFYDPLNFNLVTANAPFDYDTSTSIANTTHEANFVDWLQNLFYTLGLDFRIGIGTEHSLSSPAIYFEHVTEVPFYFRLEVETSDGTNPPTQKDFVFSWDSFKGLATLELDGNLLSNATQSIILTPYDYERIILSNLTVLNVNLDTGILLANEPSNPMAFDDWPALLG